MTPIDRGQQLLLQRPREELFSELKLDPSLFQDVLHWLSKQQASWYKTYASLAKKVLSFLPLSTTVAGSSEACQFLHRLKKIPTFFSSRDLQTLAADAVIKDNFPLLTQCVYQGIDLSSTKNRYGKSLLYLACEKERLTIVDYLLEKGASIESGYPRQQENCVHSAARKGVIQIIEETMEMRLLDQRNSRGQTPLHLAAMSRQIQLVNGLIDKGVNINAEDASKMTPLALALSRRLQNIPARLLYCGADPFRIPRSGFRPLEEGYYDLIRGLLKANDAWSFQRLLASGVDFSRPLRTEFTVRAAAVYSGQEYIADLLPEDPLSRVLVDRIFLASVLSVRGRSSFQGTSFDLEGTEGSAFPYEKFASHLDDYPLEGSHFSHEDKQELIRILTFSSKQREAEEWLEQLQQTGIVAVPCGWKSHAIGVVFFEYNNSLYQANCNRADLDRFDSIHLFQVESARISTKTFDEIMETNVTVDRDEEALDFYYKQLPISLSSSKHPETDAFCFDFYQLGLSRQKVGNCSFSNAVAVLRCLVALILLRRAGSPDEISSELAAQIREESKQMTLHLKWRIYQETFDKEMELPVEQRDYRLLREAHRNLSATFEKWEADGRAILGAEPRKPRKRKSEALPDQSSSKHAKTEKRAL